MVMLMSKLLVLPRQLARQQQRLQQKPVFHCRYRSVSTTPDSLNKKNNDSNNNRTKIPVCWLDLRGSGLSVLERLLLEECLMHKDVNRNWVIAGYHDAAEHRYLDSSLVVPPWSIDQTDSDDNSTNDSVVIVMGIGGKVEHVLDASSVRRDGVLTLKRFSGGGTVILDHDSIWTTLIGRPQFTHIPMFPRELMKYSAETVFGPLFDRLNSKHHQSQHHDTDVMPRQGRQTMILDSKSCGVENSGRVIVRTIPEANEHRHQPTVSPASNQFKLHENDFCLGDRKMGGNAQSIGKYGWLHHTSFLWDYREENMRAYLTLPAKRPAYRQDRSHDDFLVKLCKQYPALSKADFVQQLGLVCEEQFDTERMTLRQAMSIVNKHTGGGGLQAWWVSNSRTRILKEL